MQTAGRAYYIPLSVLARSWRAGHHWPSSPHPPCGSCPWPVCGACSSHAPDCLSICLSPSAFPSDVPKAIFFLTCFSTSGMVRFACCISVIMGKHFHHNCGVECLMGWDCPLSSNQRWLALFLLFREVKKKNLMFALFFRNTPTEQCSQMRCQSSGSFSSSAKEKVPFSFLLPVHQRMHQKEYVQYKGSQQRGINRKFL